MLLAADTPFGFDAWKDNLGMVVMGLLVVVLWLAFRKMVELSQKKAKGQPPKK